jgi:peptidoglycan/xylan/chitin deacetylase (PgdA/CDA1 family)
MKYFVKTPWWLKMMYPRRVWTVNTKEKIIYLTFDDGPHPEATPFVLDELKKAGARATFFCIGKNVVAYPDIFKRITEEGHSVGNHTNNHLNGWKTDDELYLANVTEAAQYIKSDLFRPPYGRMRISQGKRLSAALNCKQAKIIMWDILSGDFDTTLSGEECFFNATRKAVNGSVIIFHDSEKALPRLRYALPKVLDYFAQMGYSFNKI